MFLFGLIMCLGCLVEVKAMFKMLKSLFFFLGLLQLLRVCVMQRMPKYWLRLTGVEWKKWKWLVLITWSPDWKPAFVEWMLCLCRAQNPHHPGFQLRRTSRWQCGVCWYKGVRHTTVDLNKHHVRTPRAATGPVWCACTGWKQWLPPDTVQLQQKSFSHLVIWKCCCVCWHTSWNADGIITRELSFFFFDVN